MVELFLASPKSKYAMREYLKVARLRNLDMILINLSKSPTEDDLGRQQAITTMTNRADFELDDSETERFKKDVNELLETLPPKEGYLWVLLYTTPYSKSRLHPHLFPCGGQRSSNAENAV